nr:MAG TPA: hypothetical protein [Caudoviricetes sp.]
MKFYSIADIYIVNHNKIFYSYIILKFFKNIK